MEQKDIIIIGAGPAGLSAAIYTARGGASTLVLGCNPKVAGEYVIDNYFGFPKPITGKELIQRGIEQAKKFGAEIKCEKVLSIHFSNQNTFLVKTETNQYESKAIILATGVTRVRPGIDNLKDYEGKGVSYCVSCDGFFYKNKKVAVLGEGVFAANQALELTEYTKQITIFTQGKKPSFSQEFAKKLESFKIPVRKDKIISLKGNKGLEQIVLENGDIEPLDGLFIAMGEASSLDFAYTLGLTRKGVFIEADFEQKTNIPGVFAAGDCVGRFLQISVAVGEGAIAGKSALNYIKTLTKS
ncbi:thioredoxin reductase (NADPH) [Desulfonauticus submarinus]|uniref:Thioredoxin reductase (NADPH) n=1 Tax=Desulfonauticus submarinus TaxID=206665 RepID=A0A1G9ZKU5_9BACT|nr:NAD(P)/FAD-dependent oxidoreductase [Desulfonauticus submarinus]SDN21705.1 thioredoxin reductase (NADPH) [Desulfonauticus submarinus]